VILFGRAGALQAEVAACNNLGLTYRLQGFPQRAEAIYTRALSIIEADDFYSQGVLLLNLGDAYWDRAEREKLESLSDQAIKLFHAARKAFEKAESDYGRAVAAANLGRLFLLQGQSEAAIHHLARALQWLPEDAPEREEIEHWLQIAFGYRSGVRLVDEVRVTLQEKWFNVMFLQPRRPPRMLTLLLQVEHDETHHAKVIETDAVPAGSDSASKELLKLAKKAYQAGYLRQAISWYEETILRAKRERTIEVEFDALEGLAEAWSHLGIYKPALDAATSLLARAREVQSPRYEMIAKFYLTVAFAGIDLPNRWDEIQSLLLQGLDETQHLSDTYYEASHLCWLGIGAVHRGKVPQAQAWLQDASNVLESGDDDFLPLRVRIYGAFAELMCSRGDLTEALRYAELAYGIARQELPPFYRTYAQLPLAEVERARERMEDALNVVNEVLDAASSYGWVAHEQQAQLLRAELLLELNQPAEARLAARQALTLSKETEAREAEVRALISLGRALVGLNRKEEAQATLKVAQELSRERGYRNYQQQIQHVVKKVSEQESSNE
jgi:tetratricopeptide (TPR) repeat protein